MPVQCWQLASSQTGVVILKSFQRGRRTGGCVSRTELRAALHQGDGVEARQRYSGRRGAMGSKLFQGEGAGACRGLGWGQMGRQQGGLPLSS